MSIYQKRLDKFINEVRLYPVSCEKLCRGRSDLEWLDAVLAGGAKIVQLRDKISSARSLLNKAHAFREKTDIAGALFIVNDRLDIALLSDADGVHLGNDDLPVEEARRLAPELIIGVSCNREEEAITAAKRGASYYNIGPIFPTKTKEEAREYLGVAAIKQFSRHSSLPFTVMGGIKAEHIPLLRAEGVQRPALVSAITMADDMKSATEALLNS